jgi:hypothetical protein
MDVSEAQRLKAMEDENRLLKLLVAGERKHYWMASVKRWKCYACRKQFSAKVGSIFEDSALPLDK